jgi:tripartite-type tricarboxylate transporter receptor subunit TctC
MLPFKARSARSVGEVLMSFRICRGALLSIALAASFPSFECAAEDPVADFYKGRQVAIVVGTPPGSSLSLYSQALARHMGRHLPGNPSFVVQHMPGAGGLTAANNAYNFAPRDGTALVTTNRTVLIEPLLGGKGAQFDALKFTWLGSTNVEYTVCLSWHTAPVKTLQDAFAKELVIGSYGAAGPSAVFAKAANKLAGTRFTVIGGYQGGPQALLAMERGEVEGFCAMSWSELKRRKAEWLTQKKVNMLFQMALERHPDLLDVPLISDHARTPEDRRVFELLFAPHDMGRPFYAPPGVPADRAQALRSAFERTLKNPQFLADSEKAGLDIHYVGGDSIQRTLERMYAAPRSVIERAMTIAD